MPAIDRPTMQPHTLLYVLVRFILPSSISIAPQTNAFEGSQARFYRNKGISLCFWSLLARFSRTLGFRHSAPPISSIFGLQFRLLLTHFSYYSIQKNNKTHSSVPVFGDKCPVFERIPVDTTTGNILISRNGNAEVGAYPGPVLDPLTAALLPPGFVSPYAGVTPSGLLGNASTPLSTFLASTALTDSDGSIFDVCSSAPRFQYPILREVPSRKEIESTTYKRWGRENFMSSIDISELSDTKMKFDVFYNNSLTGGSDLPIFINFVSNALWRTVIGVTGLDPDVYLVNPGKKGYPRGVYDRAFDIISLGCPNLYIYIFLLLLPITMENLVAEKENRLRETMRMMGLKTHVYFLATYLWNYFLYFCLATLACVMGLILGFTFWLHNAFLAWFLLFFIWGHTLIAMSWLLSIFITSARTAVVVGYAIILAFGILCTNLIRDIIIDKYTPAATLFGISIIPPLAFFRGLTIINNQISWKGPGMSTSDIGPTDLWQIYVFLLVEWLVCIVLAIYFELVLPIGPGSKKDPLFFLPRRFWVFKTDESKAIEREKQNLAGHHKSAGGDEAAPSSSAAAVGHGHEDDDDDKPDDVLAEEERTLNDPNLVVKSLGLHKVYARGGKRKVAVRRLTMGIRNGECFGFLGPNGAGKSTTISMLCGYLRPTSGTATINGLSIREDMDDIHLQMGVCPQDDALWADLTGPEHLEFYGRLKNLSGKELKKEIDFWLEQVNLNSKKTRVKSSSEYSGGMKRRLSVACAMIGSPSVVLLDEPTTGLDPASRISLWEVVRKFKSQCAMMLTTHSMDEAEALCDRLGIFVAGRLKTIGHASELKERYGKYYKIQITTNLAGTDASKKGEKKNLKSSTSLKASSSNNVPPPPKNSNVENMTEADLAILDLLKQMSPNVRLLNSLAGTNNFEAPSDEIKLSDLFDAIEQNKTRLGITHWGVSNTTLEEVFLKVTADEVQDEALKFAKKKKGGCCSCCYGADADVANGDIEANGPNSVEMVEDGDAGFLADPNSSNKRLETAVNEYAPDSDDESEVTDEGDEESGTSTSPYVDSSDSNQSA